MWMSRGYECPDSVSELRDSLAGRTVLVCGNGQGVFEDMETACAGEWPVFFGVNDVGAQMPELDHFVTLHGEQLSDWTDKRRERGLECRFKTHTAYCLSGDYNWSGLEPIQFPLSGLFAMQVAWCLGAERIVLCGCPGDDRPRFNGTKNDTQGFAYGAGTTDSDRSLRALLDKEMKRVSGFRAAVRSMSGQTKRYFSGDCND